MHDVSHLTTAELRDYAHELAEVNAHEPNRWTLERAEAIRVELEQRDRNPLALAREQLAPALREWLAPKEL